MQPDEIKALPSNERHEALMKVMNTLKFDPTRPAVRVDSQRWIRLQRARLVSRGLRRLL